MTSLNPMFHVALGPRLKPSYVPAKCPKCSRFYVTKLAEKLHEYTWTGRGIPRVYCPNCQAAMSHHATKSRQRIKYITEAKAKEIFTKTRNSS